MFDKDRSLYLKINDELHSLKNAGVDVPNRENETQGVQPNHVSVFGILNNELEEALKEGPLSGSQVKKELERSLVFFSNHDVKSRLFDLH